MTTPTPEPTAVPELDGLAYFLQTPGQTDIFAVFRDGYLRHALPVEWRDLRATEENPAGIPVVAGTTGDFVHASALANAAKGKVTN